MFPLAITAGNAFAGGHGAMGVGARASGVPSYRQVIDQTLAEIATGMNRKYDGIRSSIPRILQPDELLEEMASWGP